MLYACCCDISMELSTYSNWWLKDTIQKMAMKIKKAESLSVHTEKQIDNNKQKKHKTNVATKYRATISLKYTI